jgi:hypothetical protein
MRLTIVRSAGGVLARLKAETRLEHDAVEAALGLASRGRSTA